MSEIGGKKALTFKEGMVDSIPIALAYLPFAFGFGVAATKAGLPLWIAQLMSACINGSVQFAVLNLIQGGAMLLLNYLIVVFIINCRYILFGISLSQKLDKDMTTGKRLIFGFFNTDEIYAVALQKEKPASFPYLMALGLVPYAAMAIGTFVSCVATNLMPAALSSAFGIIAFAMFIAIIVPPVKVSRAKLFVMLNAITISVLLECNPLVRARLQTHQILLICTIATSLIGAIFFPLDSKEEAKQ